MYERGIRNMQSNLDSYKKIFIEAASGLGYNENTVYDKLDETALANGYCDAEEAGDETKRNQYYSALMLRYWYKIYKYIDNSKSCRLEDVDFISWLSEAISAALYYKSWRHPGKAVSNDKKAVDKIINRCCSSVRLIHYQEFNKDKRKINFLTQSIEEDKDKYGNASKSTAVSYDNENSFVTDLVDMYVRENKILEAIIVDFIGFQDVLKQQKTSFVQIENVIDEEDPDKVKEVKSKEYRYSYSFDKNKLKNRLLGIDQSYLEYFANNYIQDGQREIFEDTSNKLLNKKIKSAEIKMSIDNTLLDLSSRLSKNL